MQHLLPSWCPSWCPSCHTSRLRHRRLQHSRTMSSSMPARSSSAEKQQEQQEEQQQPNSTQFTDIGLEQLRGELQDFAAQRDWQQFHTPRNLLLALVGEVGELSEIFQWRGEVAPGLPGFSPAERAHIGQELSDVLLYLVRLADVSGVDLGAAVREKLASNAAKYPAEKCKGKADKYTAYQDAKRTHQEKQQQEAAVEQERAAAKTE